MNVRHGCGVPIDVLHDSNTLGVDGAQVGVFEQANEVGFTCLLQCKYGRTLETQVRLEVLRNFSHQTLKGSPRITSPWTSGIYEFAKRDSSWPVAMSLLHTTILNRSSFLAAFCAT